MTSKIPPEVQKLIDIYTKAQEQLVKAIKEKEAKGTITAYQKSLLNQVMEQLNKLDNEAKNWTDEAIPDSYNAGADAVDSYLKNNRLDTGFSQLNTGAIQTLIDDCYGKLNEANNFIGRHIQDAVRQAGIDAVAQKLAQGQTVNECKKNLVQALIDEGITCIKDRRGRNIDLRSYAEVVARSTTREATNTATLNQLQNYGYDLVKMSKHSPTCSICAIYQGRVYSISGKSSDYPPLDTAYSGDYANIHPNCAHVLEPYIPALADDPEGDKDFSNRPFELSDKDKSMLEQYNKQQAQKAQLRMDRKQYEKYKNVLGDNAPKSFANFRQLKYNNTDKWEYIKGLNDYLTKYPTSDKRFYNIQNELKELGIKNGVVLPANPKQAFILPDVKNKNDPNHILNRMLERRITDDDIRSYMNKAKVMFIQWKGERQVFYTNEGVAVITKKDDGWIFKTAWDKSDFDDSTEKILKVVDKYVK